MPARPTVRTIRAALLLAGLALVSQGCRAIPAPLPMAPPDVPRELAMQTLPAYVVEPPDVLLIEVHRWPTLEDQKTIDRLHDPMALKPQPISGLHLVGPD